MRVIPIDSAGRGSVVRLLGLPKHPWLLRGEVLVGRAEHRPAPTARGIDQCRSQIRSFGRPCTTIRPIMDRYFRDDFRNPVPFRMSGSDGTADHLGRAVPLRRKWNSPLRRSRRSGLAGASPRPIVLAARNTKREAHPNEKSRQAGRRNFADAWPRAAHQGRVTLIDGLPAAAVLLGLVLNLSRRARAVRDRDLGTASAAVRPLSPRTS